MFVGSSNKCQWNNWNLRTIRLGTKNGHLDQGPWRKASLWQGLSVFVFILAHSASQCPYYCGGICCDRPICFFNHALTWHFATFLWTPGHAFYKRNGPQHSMWCCYMIKALCRCAGKSRVNTLWQRSEFPFQANHLSLVWTRKYLL